MSATPAAVFEVKPEATYQVLFLTSIERETGETEREREGRGTMESEDFNTTALTLFS